MKICSKEVTRTEKWIRVVITYKRKLIGLHVRLVSEGKSGRFKMKGDYKSGISTSYLDYFNTTPEHIRKQHFFEIKKFVETKS